MCAVEQKRLILLHELIRYIVSNSEFYVQISISNESNLTIHSSLLQKEALKFKERLELHFNVKYKTNLHILMSDDISQVNNDYGEELMFFTDISEDCGFNLSFSREIYIASLALEIAQKADISQFIEDTSW